MPTIYLLFSTAFFVLVLSTPSLLDARDRNPPSVCSYELQVWNTQIRTSVMKKQVRHAYGELLKSEIDPVTGCTVCSEDQVTITVPPLSPFSVCFKLAPKIGSLIEHLVREGEPINTVIGYRVIRSRGPADSAGNRTEFSNHSFGTAIDINPEQNGLYENCTHFGPECRLLRGGEWRPGTPGSLEKNSDIVVLFKQKGFKWGGEIAGRQKDFMHFSMTGY
ncbi:MAG: hypothetical protein A2010_10855 [Nitrospirae bacterium GWD2_57_9]|nr:MAG: hypothetical protein A2010_10855 [Nitrospirae bacterium GWD2_57_9]